MAALKVRCGSIGMGHVHIPPLGRSWESRTCCESKWQRGLGI